MPGTKRDLKHDASQLGLLPQPSTPIAAYVDRWAPVIGRVATERRAAQLAAWEALEAAE